MNSRLLDTLNAQAAAATDPVIWAKAVCRAASHFAVHGRTAEAMRAISVVRGQFGRDLHFDIASWLMLAEGVLHYYLAQFPESYDRIRRAYGLAIALQNTSAFPSCAAWMASLEYESSSYDEMFKHLGESFAYAHNSDYQALARASLLTGSIFHLAGSFEKARPWYNKARINASLEGDDATLCAVFYNLPAYRATNLRLIQVFGHNVEAETTRLKLEASSSTNYSVAVGSAGLMFLEQMMNGLIATLDRDPNTALEHFLKINVPSIPKRLRAPVLVDIAWCNEQIGDQEACEAALRQLYTAIDYVSDDDDLAYIHGRLAQVRTRVGNAQESVDHLSIAEQALKRHRSFQENMIRRLEAVVVVT